MDENREKLQFKDRLLWSRVAEKSDSNQVEFRHRIDLLDAAHTSLLPIWLAIHTKTSELKLASKPRRLWIEWGIFCVGALINWLFASEGKSYSGFGGALMVGAACSHLFGLVKRFMLESEVQKLVEQQSVYLFYWLGTGASREDFWSCQRAAIRMSELEGNSRDTDLWRAEYQELKDASRNRLINIRHDILWRTSGDYQGGWAPDLDGVNLPREVG
jgi:hypothetical protein